MIKIGKYYSEAAISRNSRKISFRMFAKSLNDIYTEIHSKLSRRPNVCNYLNLNSCLTFFQKICLHFKYIYWVSIILKKFISILDGCFFLFHSFKQNFVFLDRNGFSVKDHWKIYTNWNSKTQTAIITGRNAWISPCKGMHYDTL